MKLNKLILHGFKSFADRVEISFENGVTGVVGPNGCGKSNIADAVRWVLGEQSAKALRGAHMEDVIFNGTENRRRLSFCEVSLVFDNSDGALAIEYAEVQVTRRMYRSGESEYSINGASCRRSDIIELFRDTGIGKEGYSIVGQGRIDEILSQKSEDRRLVFEEAAGVMKYKTRKTDAERRIERTRANRDRVEDMLGGLEGRLEPLKQQSEAAREYMALREEQKKLDMNAFLVRSERWAQRLEELKRDGAQAAESLSQLQEELAQAAAKRLEEQAVLDEMEAAAAGAREDVQEAIGEHDRLESSLALLRERRASLEREKERLEQELAVARGGEEAARDAAEKLLRKLEGDRAALTALERERDEAVRARDEADREVERLDGASREEEQKLIDEMNRLSDARSREGALKGIREAVAAQKVRVEGDIAREEKAGASLAELLEEEERRALAAADEAARAEKDALAAQEAASNAAKEQEQARAAADEARLALRQNESRLHLLEELKRDYDGYQGSVRQVLLAARKMPDSGVHGVVADILTVPEELEKALDMALGAAVQNIVVDRDEDAKRMIEYLRANRLGRATFLPVGSVRGRVLSQAERRVLAMPGCLGVASELVAYDERYRGIVESLLGRTVIAKDLQQGIAIQRAGGYQFRLVTLEGDVMHSGGSMTGGSVQSRASSLLSRGREISSLRSAIGQGQKSLKELEERIRRADEARAAARDERQVLLNELTARRVAAARADEQLRSARGERDSHAQRLERLRASLEQLASQDRDAEAELKALESASESAGTAREDSQQRLDKIMEELASAREAAQKAADAATEKMVSAAALEKSVEASQREHARLTQITGTSEDAQRDAGKKLEGVREEIARAAAGSDEAQSALEKAKEALSEKRAEFARREERRTGAQKAIQALTQEQDGLRERADGETERKHRLDMQAERVEADIRQMTERIWEDWSATLADAEPYREEGFRLQDSDRRVAAIKQRIRELGSVNVSALDEYRETVARVEDMTAQRDDMLKAEADLDKLIRELEGRMGRQFREKLDLIDGHFRRIFTALFGGGKALLRLEDPNDPMGSGIEIEAQPPGKKLVALSLLSGGERALTAIALLFSILEINPSPFCILDEIEAALDDANIDNYAQFLRDYASRTQFVIITHRKGTMEKCDALYGVVMQEKGISKTLNVTLGEAVRPA